MHIPSPRKFIEVVAFVFFGLFVCAGLAFAVALMLLIWTAERICDGVQAMKARRRA